MRELARQRRLFRFGVFEFDSSTGELRRDGKTELRLRDQAAQILCLLVERPREVVTRDELREKLWPADTFVDFDHGLNSAINQLRNALGDSAANPRFIQTLPRRGYRFIAPLEPPFESPTSGTSSSPPTELPASLAPASFLRHRDDLPAASGPLVRILFSLIQLMYLSFYLLSLARLREIAVILQDSSGRTHWTFVLLILTAAVGIPVRLYLLTAMAFRDRSLARNFLRLFPFLFPLDELWALAPFLLVAQLGWGLAIGFTAALLYVPFSQRTLLLMPRSSPSA